MRSPNQHSVSTDHWTPHYISIILKERQCSNLRCWRRRSLSATTEFPADAAPCKTLLHCTTLKLLHQFRTWEQKLKTGSAVKAGSEIKKWCDLHIVSLDWNTGIQIALHFPPRNGTTYKAQRHVHNTTDACQHVMPTVYITKYRNSGNPKSIRAWFPTTRAPDPVKVQASKYTPSCPPCQGIENRPKTQGECGFNDKLSHSPPKLVEFWNDQPSISDRCRLHMTHVVKRPTTFFFLKAYMGRGDEHPRIFSISYT